MYSNIEIPDSGADIFNYNSSHLKYPQALNQNEQYCFKRLQQQTQRMEHMTRIIQKYSEMLQKYESDNNKLKNQNENLRNYEHLFERAQIENEAMKIECSKISNMLIQSEKKNQMLLKELQISQKENKIATRASMTPTKGILSASFQKDPKETKPGSLYSRQDKFIPSNEHNPERILQPLRQIPPEMFEQQLLKDYSALAQMYEELKCELYSLHKENIDLKSVIQDQSKLYNQFSIKQQKYSSPQKQLSNNSKYKQQKKQTSMSSKKQDLGNTAPSNEHNPIDRQKIKKLKKQLKKQTQLLEKYQQTQKQQLELIQMLKSQKSKICLCHSHATSKKLIGTSQSKFANVKSSLKNVGILQN